MLKQKNNAGADINSPVMKEPIRMDRLSGLLHDSLKRLFPDDRPAASVRIRRNAFNASLRKFEDYLTSQRSATVTLNESTLEDFERHLAKANVAERYIPNHCYEVRKLINELPSTILLRPLMDGKDVDRATKWATFTPQTKQVIDDFRHNGRKLTRDSSHMNPKLSQELLGEKNRKNICDRILTFLRAIESADVFSITKADAQKLIGIYQEKGNEAAAIALLDQIRPFFSYMVAKGMMTEQPLVDIPNRTWNQNFDYVAPDDIDILAASKIDMNDFLEVRDKLLTYTLCYDFSLRINTVSLIQVPWLCMDDQIGMVLPKHVMKTKKPLILYSYFPDISRALLERYLELRERLNPSTDVLIVSSSGQPLSDATCRDIVKNYCDKIGIKTVEGNSVCPHRLRHSFGTLNINPLGLGLDITEIMEHLHHSSIQITYDTYITKNPLLAKARHRERMRKVNGNNANRNQNARNAPVNAHNGANDCGEMDSREEQWIAELEAIRATRDLGINYRSLRKYAVQFGKAKRDGRAYLYSSSFIVDIANNYFTRSEAMDLLKFPKATLFEWAKQEDIELIRIGQTSLFRKDVVLSKKRAS